MHNYIVDHMKMASTKGTRGSVEDLLDRVRVCASSLPLNIDYAFLLKSHLSENETQ